MPLETNRGKQMTDLTITPTVKQNGSGKVISTFIVGGLSSYLMTWLSLRGYDFKALGVDSETVKALLVATLSAAFVAFTPSNILTQFLDIIRFIKNARKQITDELNKPDQE